VKKTPFVVLASAVLSISLAALLASCQRSGSTTAKPSAAASNSAGGKRWRLANDTVGANSIDSYKKGVDALRTLDAFGTADVQRLFYHGKLIMVPAGTLVQAAGATPPSGSFSPIEVHVLEGPHSGKTLWLYPESAAKMGFLPKHHKH